MNPCVKTGFIFINVINGEKSTGDLKFDPTLGWHITGVPPATPRSAPHARVHATFNPRRDRPGHEASVYLDSEAGVELLAISDEFRSFIASWYPEHIAAMPAEKLDNGDGDGNEPVKLIPEAVIAVAIAQEEQREKLPLAPTVQENREFFDTGVLPEKRFPPALDAAPESSEAPSSDHDFPMSTENAAALAPAESQTADVPTERP